MAGCCGKSQCAGRLWAYTIAARSKCVVQASKNLSKPDVLIFETLSIFVLFCPGTLEVTVVCICFDSPLLDSGISQL